MKLKWILTALPLIGLLIFTGCDTVQSGDSGDSASSDFYVMEHDGRTYVLGSAESAAKFNAQKHIPYAKSFIGKGPKGNTLIFEISKDDDALLERLMSTYNAQYGTSL